MDLEAAGSVSSDEEELMKVWLMVLTEMPYSSTSALRQSKKAWTACLEAASGGNVTNFSLLYNSRAGNWDLDSLHLHPALHHRLVNDVTESHDLCALEPVVRSGSDYFLSEGVTTVFTMKIDEVTIKCPICQHGGGGVMSYSAASQRGASEISL